MGKKFEFGKKPGQGFNAPLIAGALVLVGILVAVAVFVFSPKDRLTIDGLNTPAVAALGGGSDSLPANSREALEENAKFGYLPAIDLAKTADGDLVLANADTAQADLNLSRPLDKTATANFLSAKIPPAKSKDDSEEQTRPGTPITFDDAMKRYGKYLVFAPGVESQEVLTDVLDITEKRSNPDALIVRSTSLEVLSAAEEAGATGMYTGEVTSTTAGELREAGISMVALEAAEGRLDTDAYDSAGIRVWASGVESQDRLKELEKDGVFGALTTDPFAVQPPAVKSNE
ncbi:hypothetical protein [Brevibacterium sp. Marseille-P9724]|uniref:hypothetical protein n=1 Tax=Brevibacterium sp. Marseille-P9724 TaxID=2614125 RepID=UPI00125F3989|nr:hypothetical protein [Brevibacterium sp. Marseille-P9724]